MPQTPTPTPRSKSSSSASSGPPPDLRKWMAEVGAANRAYDRWEAKYRCKTLREFYDGQQWPEDMTTGDILDDPYTVNLVFPTIEAQLPSLYFFNPRAIIIPKPGKLDDSTSEVFERAQLREDTVNTFIADPGFRYKATHKMALRDSMFRFGVTEFGYSGDIVDNPDAGKPVLDEKGNEIKGATQPARLPKSDHLFVRHIPAHTFRVSVRADPILERCDWAGYYEWVHVADLQKDKTYQNTSSLQPGGVYRDGLYNEDKTVAGPNERYPNMVKGDTAPPGMLKVWKLWSYREGLRCVFAEGHPKWLLAPEKFAVKRFTTIKFYEAEEGWYPIPYTYNWLSPQRELNETRESQRQHRRRFYRRYQALKGTVDPEELDKLEVGGDGTVIMTNADEPIKPIPDAPLDSAITRNIGHSKEDFMQISGVGGDQRGASDTETATQATIVETRLQIREESARAVVAAWMGDGARVMLDLIEKYFTLPMWILRNVDMSAPGAMQEAARVQGHWEKIKDTATAFGPGTDYEVTVDVTSIAPVNQQAEQVNWTNILMLLAKPEIQMTLGASEVLLRKTLKMYGITNGKEIAEVQQILMKVGAMQMMMAGGAMAPGGAAVPGGPAGNLAPGAAAAPGGMPGAGETQNQLDAQVGQ